MTEKFQLYKKSESVVHNFRRWGNWITNGLLGLGSVLTAIPPTAPVGVAILGGASVDKSWDLTGGNAVEEKYDEITGKRKKSAFTSNESFPQSGSIMIFPQEPKEMRKAA